MRVVYCTVCHVAYQIGGDFDEIKNLIGGKDNFPCITPLCQGRMKSWTSLGTLPSNCKVVEIPVRNFFRAIHGFGMSDGAAASFERARELLSTK